MVTWSDHAKADLRHIHDFIAADSRHYAKKVTQAIVDKTLQLSELPRIGKVVPVRKPLKSATCPWRIRNSSIVSEG